MKTEYIIVTGDPATDKTTFVRDNFQNRKDTVIFEDVCKLTKFAKNELKILKGGKIVFVVQKQNLETFFKSLPKSIVVTKIIDLSASEPTSAMKFHDYQIKEMERFKEYISKDVTKRQPYSPRSVVREILENGLITEPKKVIPLKFINIPTEENMPKKEIALIDFGSIQQMGRFTLHGANQPVQGRSMFQNVKSAIFDDQEKIDIAYKNGREKARMEFSETLMQERKIYQQGINDYFDARINKLQKENTKLQTDVRYYKAGIWIFFAVIVIQAILKNI